MSRWASIAQARSALRQKPVDHILVQDGGTLVGILDVQALAGAPSDGLIATAMTPRVVSISLSASLERARSVMRETQEACLVVTWRHGLIGTLCAADLDQTSRPGASFPAKIDLQHAEADPIEEHGGLHVLLADDDLEARWFVASILRSHGYRVSEVGSGTALMKHLRLPFGRADLPDLILSDVMMPGWSGVEVLALLQQSGASIPIVLMTGFDSGVIEVAAAEFGAAGLLRKPFSATQLLDVLDGLG
jgi:CheY-like chemotaxis protein